MVIIIYILKILFKRRLYSECQITSDENIYTFVDSTDKFYTFHILYSGNKLDFETHTRLNQIYEQT